MIKIGGREAFHSAHFICPEDELAELRFKAPGASLEFIVRIEFAKDEEKNRPSIHRKNIQPEGDNLVIELVFVNWNKTYLGDVASSFAWPLVEIDRKEMSMVAKGSNVGGLVTVFAQFMIRSDDAGE